MATRTLTLEQKAAKAEYDKQRRAAIKAGVVEVKPRGTSGERAPRGRSKATAVNLTKLTKDVKSILSMVNMGLLGTGMVPMSDALTEDEQDLLARGIALELQQHPEWLTAISGALGQVSAHGALAAAILAIALPRMARRKMIPEEIAVPLTGIVYLVGGSVSGAPGAAAPADAVSVGRDGTPRFDRDDREREEYVSGNAVAGPQVPFDPED